MKRAVVSKESILRGIKKARDEVASWPDWKTNFKSVRNPMTEAQEKLKPRFPDKCTLFQCESCVETWGEAPTCPNCQSSDVFVWDNAIKEARIAELEEALTLAVEWFTDCPDDPIEFSATLQHFRNALKGSQKDGE